LIFERSKPDGHTYRVRMGVLSALASLAFAAPALAQDDGVYIDPDSPSAKEYSIPLESERRQADPGHDPQAGTVQGERSSPIFGAGIVSGRAAAGATTARAGGAETPRAERSAADDDKNGRGTGARSRQSKQIARGSDAEVLQAATSNPGPPAGGLGVPLTIGGVAIGVLLLGGLVGLLLRRRAG
jgi:hypothetical protein